MKRKIKAIVVAVVCFTMMTAQVMAVSTASSYSGPIGALITGKLSVTTDIAGGRPVAKHLTISTNVGKTVQEIIVKYDIRNKSDGEIASVHNASDKITHKNTSSSEDKWNSYSSELGGAYKVFATHEMKNNGNFHAVYTATDI